MGDLLTATMATYNRPYMVKCFLDEDAQVMREMGVDFWIYDGSTNQETRAVVSEFISKGFDNIHYVYQNDQKVMPLYDKHTIEYTLHKRPWQAFFSGESKYTWFTGDKIIMKKHLFKKLLGYLKEYDADCFFLHGQLDDELIEYKNSGEFFRDVGWLFTGWGNWIIKSDIKDIIKKNIRSWYSKYSDTGFEIQYIVWEAFARKQNFKAICWNVDFIKRVKNTPQGTSVANDIFENVWITGWLKANDALPDVYQPYTSKVLTDWGKHTGHFTMLGFVDLRRRGCLDKRIYERNKENYPRLSDCSLRQIKLIAYMPTWVAEIVYFEVYGCILIRNKILKFLKRWKNIK